MTMLGGRTDSRQTFHCAKALTRTETGTHPGHPADHLQTHAAKPTTARRRLPLPKVFQSPPTSNLYKPPENESCRTLTGTHTHSSGCTPSDPTALPPLQTTPSYKKVATSPLQHSRKNTAPYSKLVRYARSYTRLRAGLWIGRTRMVSSIVTPSSCGIRDGMGFCCRRTLLFRQERRRLQG